MGISAIIYDLVGPLLVRNPHVIFDSQTQEINRRCGKAIDEKNFWKDIASEFHLLPQKIKEIKKVIAGAYIKNEPMWDFHRSIKSRYKTAIMNNGTASIFREWKKMFHFSQEFTLILNSGELGLKKPDPKIFTYCLDKLSVVPQQCIFIDDDKRNIDTAASLGFYAILYLPRHHNEFLKEIRRIVG